MTPIELVQIEEIETDASVRSLRRDRRSGSGYGAGRAESLKKRLYLAILIGLTLFLSGVIFRHPFFTNDGPVHVAFSHVLLTYRQAGQSLQQQAYALNLKPNPNLAVYFLMAALMRFLSPALTESIIQILCIAGPIAAGYFAFRSINPKSAWLAIFLLPLTLNQMFFLGLYNHAIAMAAFFLVIGLYFRLAKKPGPMRSSALAVALIVAFFCHASGFLMAYAGLGAMIAVSALRQFRRMIQATPSVIAAMRPVVKKHLYALVAMLPPIPIAALFLSSGGKSPILYDFPLSFRIDEFLKLHLLAVNYPYRDRFPALAISSLLLVAFVTVAVRIFRRHTEWSDQRRDQAISIVAATALAILIMFAFPDTMGGGWTHYHRFEVYPYFFILLTLSFETFSTLISAAFFSVATAATLVFFVSTVERQNTIREQIAPLAQMDSLIGSHCTVLPLVLESHLVNNRKIPEWMDYQPYFQAASRLELTKDRVVLFNYLARLTPYPVHFRPGAEPQANLFEWKPWQIDNSVEKVNLQGYEKGTNLKVDYILLWGTPNRHGAAVQKQVEDALAQYDLIYHSSDSWATLYRRHAGGNSQCSVADSSPELASSLSSSKN